MADESYVSVSELNAYIKTYLEANYFLQDIYVKGEISNFKVHQSGTLYFAIKDENSAINVVMFQSFAKRLTTTLKDGDMVLIKGKISVYEVRGTYSINATEVIFDSKGLLLIAFNELKNKLLNEGYFDKEHKIALPKYPNSIALLTASSGAAVHDMLTTISSRWPLAKIYIYPTLVQGENAKYDIVEKIKQADKASHDVIICGRGGGSIEDLWPFNEEIVAKAFYDCNTPIISAVGHEIDVTISDYVADARGLTPTDGAVKATPNIIDVKNEINKEKEKLVSSISNYLKLAKSEVNNYKNSYVLLNPLKIYETYRYTIDDLENRLNMSIKDKINKTMMIIKDDKNKVNSLFTNILNENIKEFRSISSKLDALSPLKILNRGYSFVSSDQKIIKSVDDVSNDQIINLSMQDGIIKGKVIGKEKKHG